MTPRIRPVVRDAILQSLSAGVVPSRGQQHIQVGRSDEVQALLRDIERIRTGGSAIRFVIGRYGSGKTFFLHLVRSISHERNLVTMHADLTPSRRLHASGGQARSLFAELSKNTATRSKPDGGALESIVERFISNARTQAKGDDTDTHDLIEEGLSSLREMAGGFTFAEVVGAYWKAFETGDQGLKIAVTRWLRAEYTTRTDARRDLGVREIIDDQNFYDQLKLIAKFVQIAGYNGLFVGLDEMVNLYKIAHTQSRTANYEQILAIVNDCLQGRAEGLGFVLGGTPEFLLDTRRGLYSYEALQTRLAQNTFARDGLKDLSGPVINLPNLTVEELYVLLDKLRVVHAGGDVDAAVLPDAGIEAFLSHCQNRIGAAYFQTPRNTIKAFVDLLMILEQNPDASWRELVGGVEIGADHDASMLEVPEDEGDESSPSESSKAEDDDELTTFKL